MGYAGAGDYLDYRIYVSQPKYYTVNFRTASERAKSELIIRIGEGNTFTALDTVVINSTGGWQTWKTVSSIVFLPEGRYSLRLYVRSGEFNTNWFQFVSASGVRTDAKEAPELQIYPNPASNYVVLDLIELADGIDEISIYNIQGKLVHSISSSEESIFRIQTAHMERGLYTVVAKGRSKILKSKFIIQ